MSTATTVKSRPILFSGPMIRALLAGQKTQTRRVAKNFPDWVDHVSPWCSGGVQIWNAEDDGMNFRECPHGKPGERLWAIQIREIPFGNGKFGVGDDGHIYNISGDVPVRRRVRLSHNGYEEITLRHKGKSQPFRVNRLVCEAFYGPPPQWLAESGEVIEVRHLNNQRRDNLPDNLDWGTRQQNAIDASATGAWSGSRNSSSKLSDADAEIIRDSSEPQAVLAERHGVTQPQISKIKNRKRRSGILPTAPPPNCKRWASRLTLEITEVRVERLNDISESDCWSEGIEEIDGMFRNAEIIDMANRIGCCIDDAKPTYACLWESINGPGSWTANPFVWVVSFRRLESSP